MPSSPPEPGALVPRSALALSPQVNGLAARIRGELALEGPRIAFVSDGDDPIVDLLCQVASREGFRTEHFHGVYEAFSILAYDPPDVVWAREMGNRTTRLLAELLDGRSALVQEERLDASSAPCSSHRNLLREADLRVDAPWDVATVRDTLDQALALAAYRRAHGGSPLGAVERMGELLRETRFLFVDDEEDKLDLIHKLGERVGFRGEFTAHGEAALRLLEAREYDVVWTNWAMPVMSGANLIRNARPSSPRHTAFLLESGNTAADLCTASREVAADGYVVCPWEGRTLFVMLAIAAERSASRRPPAERAPYAAPGTEVRWLEDCLPTAVRVGPHGCFHRAFGERLLDRLVAERRGQEPGVGVLLFSPSVALPRGASPERTGSPIRDDIARRLDGILKNYGLVFHNGGDDFAAIVRVANDSAGCAHAVSEAAPNLPLETLARIAGKAVSALPPSSAGERIQAVHLGAASAGRECGSAYDLLARAEAECRRQRREQRGT